jgi:hypothetical protein
MPPFRRDAAAARYSSFAMALMVQCGRPRVYTRYDLVMSGRSSMKGRASTAMVSTLNKFGRTSQLVLLPKTGVQAGSAYTQDGLWTAHNHEFMQDPVFASAYRRAVRAAGYDYGTHWRVHVALWAAMQAAGVPGDFVECGVGRGFVSSAILEFLPWKSMERRFYLFDTYTRQNPQIGNESPRVYYADDVQTVRTNFSEWPDVHVIQGLVPDSLVEPDIQAIAYLHIDMNHPVPETAAVRMLWPRLVPGGVLLLDDYAFDGFHAQKVAMDQVAKEMGFNILSLPTGQGLAVKASAQS